MLPAEGEELKKCHEEGKRGGARGHGQK